MKRPQAVVLIQERDAVGTIPSTDELSRVDYCGNMVYDRGERRLLLENGYVTFDITTNSPSYHFYLRDHLGNNRVVMAGDGTVEQVTHYYPFGGVMRESTNPGLQPYKYGGKELDRTSGLDAYDFGARMYFADRLQWGQMDPLCEKYYDVSPYGYCFNNPVRYIDPNGCEIRGQTKKDTNLVIEDIRAIFAAEEFSNFRKLLVPSGKRHNGKSLAKIDEKALKEAFDGIILSEDQQVLLEIVVNTINSNDVHKIEYASEFGVVSNDAKTAYNPLPIFDDLINNQGGLPTLLIINSGGGGVTMNTSSGTHTVIVNSNKYHPVGRPVTTGHEIFGHGRSLALGRTASQHVDSIQAENLIRRVMNIDLINDGSNHNDKSYIPNPTSLPGFR